MPSMRSYCETPTVARECEFATEIACELAIDAAYPVGELRDAAYRGGELRVRSIDAAFQLASSEMRRIEVVSCELAIDAAYPGGVARWRAARQLD